MSEILFKIGPQKDFSKEERQIFLKLLKEQKKVQNPTIEKINRCLMLCLCEVDNEIVSIGAIKPKTSSDFEADKSSLESFRDDFKWELGYCFTLPKHSGKGYSSGIVKLLLDKIGKINLMASTELQSTNAMLRILEKNGFKQYGKPWKSIVHNGALGLFLRFVKG